MEDVLKAVSTAGSGTETSSRESAALKASVVTEITSASLTTTVKPDTSGVERRVRWKGLGILDAALCEIDPNVTGSPVHLSTLDRADSDVSEGQLTMRRVIYAPTEENAEAFVVERGHHVVPPSSP